MAWAARPSKKPKVPRVSPPQKQNVGQLIHSPKTNPRMKVAHRQKGAARRAKRGIALGVAAALLTGGLILTRPHWQTLSPREFEALLDPKLTQTEPLDPAAQTRFQELSQAMKDLGFALDRAEPVASDTIKRIQDGSPAVATIHRLAKSGNLQRPNWLVDPRALFPTAKHLLSLSEDFTSAAEEEARAGKRASSAHHFATAIWITDQIAETAVTQGDIDVKADTSNALAASLDETIDSLTGADLAVIATALRPLTRGDALLHRAIRTQIQFELIRNLPNPLTWVKIGRSDTPEEKAKISPPLGTPFREEQTRTYDARITAQNLNRIFVPILDNALRPIDRQSSSGERFARALHDHFPPPPVAGETVIATRLDEARYRWQTSRTRNLLGDHILADYAPMIAVRSIVQRFERETTMQFIRTRIALRRYRLAQGRPAPSLNALIEHKFLPALPFDPYGKGDLRYSPERRILWSVGSNGTDEGGKTLSTSNQDTSYRRYYQDFVWRIP